MDSLKLNVLAGLRQMETEEDDTDSRIILDEDKEKDTNETAVDEQPKVTDTEESLSGDAKSPDKKDASVLDTCIENVTESIPELATAPKPLKSILKKRVPQPEIEKDSTDGEDPLIEKPKFGGSISLALKMIKKSKPKIAPPSGEKKDDDTEPKPSAFILEMEKQKDLLGSFHHQIPLNGVDVDDMDWEGTSSPQEQDQAPYSFFLQEKQRANEKKFKKIKVSKPHISKPPSKTVSNNEVEAMLAPCRDGTDSIVLITNLPFKVTSQELVVILGVWPKGGYGGIKLIADSSGSPAGHAYCVLDRHADMMGLLRMTGLIMHGRKIKVTMSSHKNLIADWKATKKALASVNKSRVARFANLPYNLKKSKLIETFPDVKISEEDIYWKPLKDGQENSGRGYVILKSSEDVKKVTDGKYYAQKRKMEIDQVHPNEMKKFCDQCQMKISEDIVLIDPFDEAEFDNIDDLQLSLTAAESNSGKEGEKAPTDSNFVVMEDLENASVPPIEADDKSDAKLTPVKKIPITQNRQPRIPPREFRRRSPERGGGPHGLNSSMPPFRPTPHVRMYDVPEKATTSDIRAFFEPILPAKIAQNLGYDIYDIQFYNPEDAWQAMKKHMLLMRKNVIKLEMLPGPPNPLPPRPMPYGRERHPDMIPPGPGSVPFRFPTHPDMGPRPMHSDMGYSLMYPGGPPGPMPMHHGGPRFPMPMHQGGPPGPMLMHPGGPSGSMHPEMMQFGGPHGPMMAMPTSMPPGMMPNVEPMSMNPNMRWPMIPPKMRIDPAQMPPPMRSNKSNDDAVSKKSRAAKSVQREQRPGPQKELIPVPPLPEDFTTYKVPPFNKDTPVGQGAITPMQGFFCQLCNKFYSSQSSAKISHCKSRGHYDRMKQFLQEKKRLRKLAEAETKSK